MATRNSAQAPEKRGRGRPPTVNYVRRTTLNIDADDARRIDAYRQFIERMLPKSRLSEPQLVGQLVLKGLDAWEREQGATVQPSLPLESPTTKP